MSARHRVVYTPAYQAGVPRRGRRQTPGSHRRGDPQLPQARDRPAKRVHEDMRGAFAKYPNNWGLKRPDRNIDHRRVLNLRRYFERQPPVTSEPAPTSPAIW